jgi:hypothetical protein
MIDTPHNMKEAQALIDHYRAALNAIRQDALECKQLNLLIAPGVLYRFTDKALGDAASYTQGDHRP